MLHSKFEACLGYNETLSKKKKEKKEEEEEKEEIGPGTRVPTILPEDLSSVSRTHIGKLDYSCPYLQFQADLTLLASKGTVLNHVHMHTYIHIINKS